MTEQEDQLVAFGKICKEYDIPTDVQEHLYAVRDWNIKLVIDDSGSMQTGRRWFEACELAQMVVDIGGTLDKDGIDVSFLNKNDGESYSGIRTSEDLKKILPKIPAGSTPLGAAIDKVLDRKKKQIIVVFVDGEADSEEHLQETLKSRNDKDIVNVNNRIVFAMCTNDDDVVKKYRKFEKQYQGVDVKDDYSNEKGKVSKIQGGKFAYPKGMYVASILLGAIFEEYDKLNEKPVKKDKNGKMIVTPRRTVGEAQKKKSKLFGIF